MFRSNTDQLERSSIEGLVYDTDVGGHGDDDDDEDLLPDPITDQVAPSNPCPGDNLHSKDAISKKKCIVFSYKLIDILKALNGLTCSRQGCGENLEYKETYVGTCLVVSWACNAVHFGGRWTSQPMCEKLRSCNLLLASAIVLSGNSFAKIGMMFKFLNLQYISSSLFNQYQNLYIAPTVNDYWMAMQKELWQERAGKDVILSGDGRNYSPGHCAQCCTYSLADMETKNILQLNVVDVRETEGRKSPNMERIGFERGMDSLLHSEMFVKEVVTDGHTEIAALFSKLLQMKQLFI